MIGYQPHGSADPVTIGVLLSWLWSCLCADPFPPLFFFSLLYWTLAQCATPKNEWPERSSCYCHLVSVVTAELLRGAG